MCSFTRASAYSGCLFLTLITSFCKYFFSFVSLSCFLSFQFCFGIFYITSCCYLVCLCFLLANLAVFSINTILWSSTIGLQIDIRPHFFLPHQVLKLATRRLCTECALWSFWDHMVIASLCEVMCCGCMSGTVKCI